MSALRKICPACSTPYHAAATFCQLDGTALVEQEMSLDPLVGTRLLEQFDVLEAVGSGGMGTVYRAHQASQRRDVAIKILHRDLAKNQDAVRRFQREARVASSLDHPNLVDVYLFGELPDGSLYLVMEYLEGRTLAQALFEDGPFPLARALRVAHAVALGVGAAHRQGIVHRDVKPENIMLVARDGDPDFVKVLDFGIARLLWDEQSHVTQSGVIFGTARYISPEGASGEATDARSDVYSLAVLTYQLLTGSVPFDDTSPVALLMKHLRQKPPPIDSRPGGAQRSSCVRWASTRTHGTTTPRRLRARSRAPLRSRASPSRRNRLARRSSRHRPRCSKRGCWWRGRPRHNRRSWRDPTWPRDATAA